jgi:hypothetical protein
MRSLALATFFLFILTLSARSFMMSNVERLAFEDDYFDEAPIISKDRKTTRLFQSHDREQLKKQLDQLAVVVTPINVPTPTPQNTLEELEKLEALYLGSYGEGFESISRLIALQEEVSELKKEHQKVLLNTDEFYPMMVFYLLINEGLDLEEINKLQGYSAALRITNEDPTYLTEYIHSDEFLEEVYRYLGVDEEEHYHQNERRIASAPLFVGEADEQAVAWREQNFEQLNYEQKALVDHLMEYRLDPSEIRELVHGYEPQARHERF